MTLLYTFVHCVQKIEKHHRGICGVFLVDKCLSLRYNTPMLKEGGIPKMDARFINRNMDWRCAAAVDSSAVVRPVLDAAYILVVSLCAVVVRIRLQTA